MLGLYRVQPVVLAPFPLDSRLSPVSHNLPLNWELDGQFDTSPTQGWGKVGARLGQGWGKVLGKVRARSGQGLDKKQGSGKVWAGKVRARFRQGSGKVGARSGQKALDVIMGWPMVDIFDLKLS